MIKVTLIWILFSLELLFLSEVFPEFIILGYQHVMLVSSATLMLITITFMFYWIRSITFIFHVDILYKGYQIKYILRYHRHKIKIPSKNIKYHYGIKQAQE